MPPADDIAADVTLFLSAAAAMLFAFTPCRYARRRAYCRQRDTIEAMPCAADFLLLMPFAALRHAMLMLITLLPLPRRFQHICCRAMVFCLSLLLPCRYYCRVCR